jgi:hypothetical protein
MISKFAAATAGQEHQKKLATVKAITWIMKAPVFLILQDDITMCNPKLQDSVMGVASQKI